MRIERLEKAGVGRLVYMATPTPCPSAPHRATLQIVPSIASSDSSYRDVDLQSFIKAEAYPSLHKPSKDEIK